LGREEKGLEGSAIGTGDRHRITGKPQEKEKKTPTIGPRLRNETEKKGEGSFKGERPFLWKGNRLKGKVGARGKIRWT